MTAEKDNWKGNKVFLYLRFVTSVEFAVSSVFMCMVLFSLLPLT